jgi:hypothetical protein
VVQKHQGNRLIMETEENFTKASFTGSQDFAPTEPARATSARFLRPARLMTLIQEGEIAEVT